MTLRSGVRASVAVSVATLWNAPDAVGSGDDAALRPPVDIRAWVAGLGDGDRSGDSSRVLTQLLLGEPVLVEEVTGDWVKVVAAGQPSGLDERGYPGWLHRGHLVPGEPPTGQDLVVDATATAVRDAPFGDVLYYGVTIGTRLAGTGVTYRGWSEVLVPGRDESAWVRAADVTAAPEGDAAGEDALAVAERLLEVPYVWGGVSGYGIDCSGLVHLAWRRFGTRLPRDASDQAAATKEIATEEASPGDLYFFARPGKKIHHVGIVAGEERMLHASQTAGRVVLEPVEGERAETLIGARRVLP